MVKLGKTQKLIVNNISYSGVYLDAGTGDTNDNILLPNNQLSDGIEVGDEVEVFVYKDSKDRIIATCKKPFAEVGELAYLKVVGTKTGVGAFLDWGLEKDLFLPYKEQKYTITIDKSYLVALYIDRTNRICATTRIYKYLRDDSGYKKGDKVHGIVYLVKKDVGAFVAIDFKYRALIPENEFFTKIKAGDRVEARVIRVREDGKLDISPREPVKLQMSVDAEIILNKLEQRGGELNLNDKSDPESIQVMLGLSKKAFKRALGNLLKAKKVEQTEEGIRLVN